MARVIRAWGNGWQRVARAPGIFAGVVVLTIASAVPLALVMQGLLAAHLGPSLVANDVAAGVNYDWWQEFLSQASGVGSTFSPRIAGFAATLDGLNTVADAHSQVRSVAALLVAYVVLWTWLGAGIIDRYARQRPTRAQGFAAACGAHARGFALLAFCGGVTYGWIFVYLHPWLMDTRLASLTRNLDSERLAFVWRLAGYAIVGTLVAGINVVLDYAKIRMVVEDRRSAASSLVAAIRFVTRNAAAVGGLYVLNFSTFLVLLAVWAVVGPAAGPDGIRMWLGFLVGQAFIAARLAFKLHFLASQTALFQRSLAHERFTAAPSYGWPDSPAVEALGAPARGHASSL